MYKGKEKCVGCGRTGEERWRVSKDSLCHECQDALAIGKALIEERGLQRGFYKMDDLMSAFMTWYAIPVPEIDAALRELLRTFSQFDSKYAVSNAVQDNYLAGQAGCGTSHDKFCLPRCTFDAAKKLCQIIKEASWNLKKDRENYRKELQEELDKQKDEIYNEGVKHGRNLLFQLNNNEITPNEFIAPIKKFSKI